MSTAHETPYDVAVEIQTTATTVTAVTYRPGRKTRAFGAHLVAHVRCERESYGYPSLPPFPFFVASELEAAASEANLREGEPCVASRNSRGGTRYEFLRSLDYAWRRQRVYGDGGDVEGVAVIAWRRDLFVHDPGGVSVAGAQGQAPTAASTVSAAQSVPTDPAVPASLAPPSGEVLFVAMPSAEWAAAQRDAVGDRAIAGAVAHCKALGLLRGSSEYMDSTYGVEHEAHVVALAPTLLLAASMLDRRIRAPILSDLRFQLQVMLSLHLTTAGSVPLASSALSPHQHRDGSLVFEERGTGALGYAPAVFVRAQQAHVERVIVEELKRYRERVGQGKEPSERVLRGSRGSRGGRTARKDAKGERLAVEGGR